MIFRYSGSTWDSRRGGLGKRIAVAPDGNPWVIAHDNTIWHLVDNKWLKVAGKAKDIGVGADGTVWIIGTNNIAHRYTGSTWDNSKGGMGKRIAVAPDGTPWIIAHDNTIWRLKGGTWEKIEGLGIDIGIGAEGAVWILGTNNVPYKMTDRGWKQHDGGFTTAITVGPYDKPWAINAKNIFAAKDSLDAVVQAEKAKRWVENLVDLRAHFDFLPDWNIDDFKIEAEHAESTGTVFGHQANIVLYMPKGKNLPNIALNFNQVDANELLKAMNVPPLIPVALKNLTLFLVPPGNGQKGAKSADLPKILKDRTRKVADKFDLEPGRNFLSEIDASKTPAVNSLASVIGLTKKNLKEMTLSGQLNRFALKKRGAWKEPFGIKGVALNQATILIVTTKKDDIFSVMPQILFQGGDLKPPYYRNVSIWGNTKIRKRNYLMFGQQAHIKRSITSKPVPTGTGYGFDAPEISLKDVVNLAKVLPDTLRISVPKADRFPLDIVTLSNPKYASYNAASYEPPVFSEMILVAATAGVVIPDGRPLPGTDGINGTPGPLYYANGALKLAGKGLGNADISLSVRGLHGKASSKVSLSLGKVIGKRAKLTGDGKFGINIDDANQRMDLQAKIDIAGFVKREATLKFSPNKAKFSFDTGCAPPIKVDANLKSASKPWDGIGNILGDISVDQSRSFECAGKAFKWVGGAIKDAGKVLGPAVNITADFATDITKEIAGKISGGFTKVGGNVFGLFKKKKKKHIHSSKDCNYDEEFPKKQAWNPSYGKCWSSGHKYLYFANDKGGNGFCLQVNAAKNHNGSKLEYGKCDMNWTQQWRFDNGKIINAKGRCIDAAGGNNAKAGSKIQLWDCHGRSNQTWKLTKNGRIVGIGGLCVNANEVKDDKDLKLIDCYTHNNAPGWMAMYPATKLSAPHYRIRNRKTNKCIDMGGERKIGSALKIWDCVEGNENQKFANPYYWDAGLMVIKSVKNGYHYKQHGAIITGWGVAEWSGTSTWIADKKSDGGVSIRNNGGKLCMQISNGNNGTLLNPAACHGNWEQRWFFEPIF